MPGITGTSSGIGKAAVDAYKNAESPDKVAQMIFKAANHDGNKMRFPVGKPAPMLLWLRKWIPDTWFFSLIKTTYKI